MDRPEPTLEGMVPARLRPVTGHILVDSLEVMADIGFHDHERGKAQRLLISVELWIEGIETVPRADEPAFAWDYDFVVGEVRRLAATGRYNLQETLVHAIFDRLAAAHGVRALRVRSAKPDIYPDAAGVGVEIASFAGACPPEAPVPQV